ncbi:CorA Metal Ion Transporter (MIT) Family, partial [Thraustotheca clavata]
TSMPSAAVIGLVAPDNEPLLLATDGVYGTTTEAKRLHILRSITHKRKSLKGYSVKSKFFGLAMIAGGNIALSLMAVLIKFSSRYFHSDEIVFWRSTSALVMNVAIQLYLKIPILAVDKALAKLLFIRVALGYTAMSTSFYAYSHMVLSEASVIIFTAPIITCVLSVCFLGEKLDFVGMTCIMVSFCGILCVSRPEFLFGLNMQASEAPPMAILCAGICAGCVGVINLLLRMLQNVNTWTLVTYFLLTCAIGSTVKILLLGERLMVPRESIQIANVLAIGFLGCIGQFMITKGLQIERAGVASALQYLNMLCVMLWDVMLLGETLHAWIWRHQICPRPRALSSLEAPKPKDFELVYEAPLSRRVKAITLTATASNSISCVGIPLGYALGYFPTATPSQVAIYGTVAVRGLGVLSTVLLNALFRPYAMKMWIDRSSRRIAIETMTPIGHKERVEIDANDIVKSSSLLHPMSNYQTQQKAFFFHKNGCKILDELLIAQIVPEKSEIRRRKDKGSDSSLPMHLGKRLTLRFDQMGRMTHEDFSRHDILKMVKEAVVLPNNAHSEHSKAFQAHATRSRKHIVDIPNIHMRDIRKLDNAFALANKPSITVRRGAIIVNADPIRAILMPKNCVVFLQDGSDNLIPLLEANFKEYESQDHPFEFTALEAILSTICSTLEKDCARALPLAKAAIDKLSNDATIAGELEALRATKNTLDELNSRVSGMRKAFVDILENEEDLRMMHLTKLNSEPELIHDLFSFDSEELESLIEVYLQDIFDTQTRLGLMQENIQNTKNIAMLKLDAKRNYLMTANLTLTLWTTLFTVPTFIVGAFGMNLNSYVQEVDYLFYIVGGLAVAFPVGAYRFVLRYFPRIMPKSSNGSDVYLTPEALLIQQPYDLAYENLASGPSGKRLALCFDIKGKSSYQELTRHDVFKKVQESAKSYYESTKGTPTAIEIPPIHMRDIRKLDNAFALAVEPAIIIRQQAILLNADPLRVVVLRDSCIVFLPDGADSLVSSLKCNFQEHITAEYIAFEFGALEAVLSTICKCTTSFMDIRSDVSSRLVSNAFEKNALQALAALDGMLNKLSNSSELENLRLLKDSLHKLESQVNGIRRILMEILDNDEDLHTMYLTKLNENPTIDLMSFDTENAESLLETYLQDIYGTQARIALLLNNIQNTENMVTLKLDTKRNYLLTVDLTLTILTTLLTVPTFIVGGFGMNLNSNIQNDDFYFYWVFGLCILFPIVSYLLVRRYLQTQGIDLSWSN